MSRAKTEEEVRNEILEHIRHMARYWAKQKDHTALERCEGVAFSILAMIDGTSASLPAMDLVLRPHSSDKQFYQARGEDWYEPGMVINATSYLHEELHR